MNEKGNTNTLIAQLTSGILVLLFLGLIPKPEVPQNTEKRLFKIPSITGFIQPVPMEITKEKNDFEQQGLKTIETIVQ